MSTEHTFNESLISFAVADGEELHLFAADGSDLMGWPKGWPKHIADVQTFLRQKNISLRY